MELYTNSKVVMLESSLLMKVYQRRNFSKNDEIRQKIVDAIGGKQGIVKGIEEKYKHDYFFFIPNGSTDTYSVPYNGVDFVKSKLCQEK